jgi:hypothetical protein
MAGLRGGHSGLRGRGAGSGAAGAGLHGVHRLRRKKALCSQCQRAFQLVVGIGLLGLGQLEVGLGLFRRRLALAHCSDADRQVGADIGSVEAGQQVALLHHAAFTHIQFHQPAGRLGRHRSSALCHHVARGSQLAVLLSGVGTLHRARLHLGLPRSQQCEADAGGHDGTRDPGPATAPTRGRLAVDVQRTQGGGGGDRLVHGRKHAMRL